MVDADNSTVDLDSSTVDVDSSSMGGGWTFLGVLVLVLGSIGALVLATTFGQTSDYGEKEFNGLLFAGAFGGVLVTALPFFAVAQIIEKVGAVHKATQRIEKKLVEQEAFTSHRSMPKDSEAKPLPAPMPSEMRSL